MKGRKEKKKRDDTGKYWYKSAKSAINAIIDKRIIGEIDLH